ncbi:hypothetical protein [Floridanema aerugineum]|uniref:Uncharacterized protein n=1 Tax=Floridaenema aerugineum BLCC-F46 TaxID=3153654 RepID=A0ABV4X8K2_9CYAN
MGWGVVFAGSIWQPVLGSALAGLMSSLENDLLGNPYEKKIYDLHMEVIERKKKLSSKDFENLNLKQKINRLQKSNDELLKKIKSQNLMRSVYITNSNVWKQIPIYPEKFGVIRLERVNHSTRFEYQDYEQFIDIFLPDPEGKGLLHGGIPIPVINPMIASSNLRKPMLYSYSADKLTNPKDCIY